MRAVLPVSLLCFLLAAAPALAGEGTVLTLWPLVDYRRSPEVDYTNLNILGPLFNYERKGREVEYGLRPFYFHAADPEEGTGYSEYLYPVARRKSGPGRSGFRGLLLLDYDFGQPRAGNSDRFTLFPLLFYGRSEQRGRYFALFPVGGKIYDRFGRDEIRFVLFPLYGQTRRKGTTATNLLWPVFARIRGEGESGVKVWPLFGVSRKEGVYRKRFFLWPVFFRYDLQLDTADPVRKRAVFPLYLAEDSPGLSARTYLWPFFSHLENRTKGYEEWNFPWPLFRLSRGEYKEGIKLLPFYADERTGDSRKRWFLWPLFKIEETRSEAFRRRRDRVLFFLFSRLEEFRGEEEAPRKRRTALWPLFTFEEVEGVGHFYAFSLLEPFFPENEGLARNWAPLWRLYQRKWDRRGNEISSFLWHLYWKERRGGDLAVELFPLFSYFGEEGRGFDFRLLKGLVRLHSGEDGGRLHFLYLPWGFGWGAQDRQDEG